jgi:hypothetical protein
VVWSRLDNILCPLILSDKCSFKHVAAELLPVAAFPSEPKPRCVPKTVFEIPLDSDKDSTTYHRRTSRPKNDRFIGQNLAKIGICSVYRRYGNANRSL